MWLSDQPLREFAWISGVRVGSNPPVRRQNSSAHWEHTFNTKHFNIWLWLGSWAHEVCFHSRSQFHASVSGILRKWQWSIETDLPGCTLIVETCPWNHRVCVTHTRQHSSMEATSDLQTVVAHTMSSLQTARGQKPVFVGNSVTSNDGLQNKQGDTVVPSCDMPDPNNNSINLTHHDHTVCSVTEVRSYTATTSVLTMR